MTDWILSIRDTRKNTSMSLRKTALFPAEKELLNEAKARACDAQLYMRADA